MLKMKTWSLTRVFCFWQKKNIHQNHVSRRVRGLSSSRKICCRSSAKSLRASRSSTRTRIPFGVFFFAEGLCWVIKKKQQGFSMSFFLGGVIFSLFFYRDFPRFSLLFGRFLEPLALTKGPCKIFFSRVLKPPSHLVFNFAFSLASPLPLGFFLLAYLAPKLLIFSILFHKIKRGKRQTWCVSS